MRKFLFILSLFTLTQVSLSFAQTQGRGEDVRDEQGVERTAPAVSVADNYLYLSDAKAGTKVVVMNMLGVTVLSFEMTSDNEKIALNLKKGFYVVKIGNLVQRFVVK